MEWTFAAATTGTSLKPFWGKWSRTGQLNLAALEPVLAFFIARTGNDFILRAVDSLGIVRSWIRCPAPL